MLPKFTRNGKFEMDHYNSDPSLENGVKNTKAEFSKSAFSPKFGVVYEVVKDKISAFANYVNGFTYNAPSLNQNGVMEKWARNREISLSSGLNSMY